jgi:hypothetical protein
MEATRVNLAYGSEEAVQPWLLSLALQAGLEHMVPRRFFLST